MSENIMITKNNDFKAEYFYYKTLNKTEKKSKQIHTCIQFCTNVFVSFYIIEEYLTAKSLTKYLSKVNFIEVEKLIYYSHFLFISFFTFFLFHSRKLQESGLLTEKKKRGEIDGKIV